MPRQVTGVSRRQPDPPSGQNAEEVAVAENRTWPPGGPEGHDHAVSAAASATDSPPGQPSRKRYQPGRSLRISVVLPPSYRHSPTRSGPERPRRGREAGERAGVRRRAQRADQDPAKGHPAEPIRRSAAFRSPRAVSGKSVRPVCRPVNRPGRFAVPTDRLQGDHLRHGLGLGSIVGRSSVFGTGREIHTRIAP